MYAAVQPYMRLGLRNVGPLIQNFMYKCASTHSLAAASAGHASR